MHFREKLSLHIGISELEDWNLLIKSRVDNILIKAKKVMAKIRAVGRHVRKKLNHIEETLK